MNNYEKLINILREIFQIDQADLDFGIYRIMNQKREEINEFLEYKLLPQVKKEILKANLGDAIAIKEELKELEAQLNAAEIDPKKSPKVQRLREELANTQPIERIEEDVFSHLATFFKRYYDKGDFISLRRYKKDTYAIPYEGEEVKLYWANHDQYYIKSSEYLKNYQFKIGDGTRSVRFELVEANTEQNNNKAQNGKERQFRIYEEKPMDVVNGDLHIYFTYLPSEKKAKREELNKTAFDTLKTALPTDWTTDLLQKVPTKTNADRTLLEKHINDFTARNTFDYFIHKDLGNFLRRELDFYIKNDVLYIDDIDTTDTKIFIRQLAKIKALKIIAHKVIAFLEQLENFQKRLWLKKKFVVATNYCITLDKIPESYHQEIAQNEAQWQEWEQLFAISELPKDLFNGGATSDRMTILKQQAHLVLDTHFFSEDFKYRLLAEFDNLDEQTDGLLINSENFQALELLNNSYKERIKSIYIDPPYNTDAAPILYKNEFRHSSWITLLENRIESSIKLGASDSIICVTIDDYEFDNLKFTLNQKLSSSKHLGTASIRNNPQGRSTVKGFSINHEYALFYSCGEEIKSVGRLERSERQKARYNEVDEVGKDFLWENFRKTGTDSDRGDRPKQFYPIYFDQKSNSSRIPKMKWIDDKNEWDILEPQKENEQVFYPINNLGLEKVWKWGYDRVVNFPNHIKVDNGQGGELQIFRRNYPNTEGKLPGTWWDTSKYAAGEYGTNLLTNMFGKGHSFPFPKSVYAVKDCLIVSGIKNKDIAIDYFAGSGTTGNAVINLNREDNGKRKYILVEMGEYFSTVTKPRIQKVIYSEDWKDGKPVSRKGSSHIFKYLRLESYEDTLNNLRAVRKETQQNVLDLNDTFYEEYLLGYMLDTETSESLLTVKDFTNPFDYQLHIIENNEPKPTTVDMVETFNYLIGLKVATIKSIDGFRVVTGTKRTGERSLVIWRNTAEKNNDALLVFFEKYMAEKEGFEPPQHIYINGDNTIANLQKSGDTWKVYLTEQVFLQQMFDVQDV